MQNSSALKLLNPRQETEEDDIWLPCLVISSRADDFEEEEKMRNTRKRRRVLEWRICFMDSAFQLQREGEIEISELGAGGCWERGQMLCLLIWGLGLGLWLGGGGRRADAWYKYMQSREAISHMKSLPKKAVRIHQKVGQTHHHLGITPCSCDNTTMWGWNESELRDTAL